MGNSKLAAVISAAVTKAAHAVKAIVKAASGSGSGAEGGDSSAAPASSGDEGGGLERVREYQPQEPEKPKQEPEKPKQPEENSAAYQIAHMIPPGAGLPIDAEPRDKRSVKKHVKEAEEIGSHALREFNDVVEQFNYTEWLRETLAAPESEADRIRPDRIQHAQDPENLEEIDRGDDWER